MMAEKKALTGGSEQIMAEKKTLTGGSEPSTESVVKLLASILSEVQKQVLRKTPKPLEGAALQAVDLFRKISAAIALQPPPTITLTADPTKVPDDGGNVSLRWTSTNAQTVSIDQNVGEVKPTAEGSIEVLVTSRTKFTATAKGPCASRTADVTVTVDD
jgi:hypothetical protein